MSTAQSERDLRDRHAAELQSEGAPSRHLLLLGEVDLRCLAIGICTPTTQRKAREYVDLLDAAILTKRA